MCVFKGFERGSKKLKSLQLPTAASVSVRCTLPSLRHSTRTRAAVSVAVASPSEVLSTLFSPVSGLLSSPHASGFLLSEHLIALQVFVKMPSRDIAAVTSFLLPRRRRTGLSPNVVRALPLTFSLSCTWL
jgi:hypothetical protein